MLDAIGARRVEDLFQPIPEKYRLSKLLNLPGPLSETDEGLSGAEPPPSGDGHGDGDERRNRSVG
jgi:hypothetical protein